MFVCVCVYIYIYIYVCVYIYIYICVCVCKYISAYIYIYIYLFMHTYIHMYIYVCVCVYIYIYIWVHVCIYIYICVGVCVCVYIYIYIYIKMNRSTKRFVFFRDLFTYFFHAYIYAFTLLLSSENIYAKRPFEWGAQWDLNSLVFEVWMVFCWWWLYIESTSLFSFLRVCLPYSVSLLINFDIWCFCHFTLGSCVCVFKYSTVHIHSI